MYRNIIIPRRKQSTLNRVTTIYLDTSPPNSYSHFSFRLQFYLIAVQLTCLLSSILWGTTSWPKMLVGRHWCVFGWVRNARFNRKVTSVSIKFRVNLSLSIIFCFLSFVFIIRYTYIHNIGLIKPKQNSLFSQYNNLYCSMGMKTGNREKYYMASRKQPYRFRAISSRHPFNRKK